MGHGESLFYVSVTRTLGHKRPRSPSSSSRCPSSLCLSKGIYEMTSISSPSFIFHVLGAFDDDYRYLRFAKATDYGAASAYSDTTKCTLSLARLTGTITPPVSSSVKKISDGKTALAARAPTLLRSECNYIKSIIGFVAVQQIPAITTRRGSTMLRVVYGVQEARDAFSSSGWRRPQTNSMHVSLCIRLTALRRDD